MPLGYWIADCAYLSSTLRRTDGPEILGVMGASMSLARHGEDVSSVFDLLGRDENDLTAALAFTLARSPGLLGQVLRRLNTPADTGSAVLRLETRGDLGRTDLEIDTGTNLIIIEAKRGWLLPGELQLAQYAPRVIARGAGMLVSLSAASPQWAGLVLPATVLGVPVVHFPWDWVRWDLSAARGQARGQERAWLDEFHEYLRKAIKMRDPADSWTYCVVVSNDRPGDGDRGLSVTSSFPKAAIFTRTDGAAGGPRPRRISSLSGGRTRSSGSTVSPARRLSPTFRPAGRTYPRPRKRPAHMRFTGSGLRCPEHPYPAAATTGPRGCGSSWTSYWSAKRFMTRSSRASSSQEPDSHGQRDLPCLGRGHTSPRTSGPCCKVFPSRATPALKRSQLPGC